MQIKVGRFKAFPTLVKSSAMYQSLHEQMEYETENDEERRINLNARAIIAIDYDTTYTGIAFVIDGGDGERRCTSGTSVLWAGPHLRRHRVSSISVSS